MIPPYGWAVFGCHKWREEDGMILGCRRSYACNTIGWFVRTEVEIWTACSSTTQVVYRMTSIQPILSPNCKRSKINITIYSFPTDPGFRLYPARSYEYRGITATHHARVCTCTPISIPPMWGLPMRETVSCLRLQMVNILDIVGETRRKEGKRRRGKGAGEMALNWFTYMKRDR